MNPNDTTPDQPVVPTTPDPAQPQQSSMPEVSAPTTAMPLDSMQKPTSPLEAITTPDSEVDKPTAGGLDASANMPDAAEPAAIPQPAKPETTAKKSKTTMYLIIVLAVVVIGAIVLYVTTL